MILAENNGISFAGATGLTVTSLGTNAITNVRIDAGRIVFDYVTPYVNPDTIHITGTDKFGNTFSINLTVMLWF